MAERKRGREGETGLVDLQGRTDPPKPPFWRRLSPKALLPYLDPRKHWAALRGRLGWAREYLNLFDEARPFLLASGVLFLAAVLLAASGRQGLALYPALVGFGLSVTSLLHGSVPTLGARLRRLSWHSALAGWGLMALLFAFLGFSSTAVVVLVLFIGGFTAVDVLWGITGRLVGVDRKREARGGPVRDATPNPSPVLLTFGLITTWAMGASFLIGFYRLHETRPFGPALLAVHIGLVVGLLPLELRAIQELRHPSQRRWVLFDPRRLLRDVLFMAGVAALIGYEAVLAAEGSALAGIPVFALALVLASYLGVLLRHNSVFRENLRPYHPIILPAFGMLLLFAPTVVLLSNLPVTVTRLYGGAQAAGLVAGALYVMMAASWRERARRIGARVQQAVKRRVPLQLEQAIPDREERIPGERSPAEEGALAIREARDRSGSQ